MFERALQYEDGVIVISGPTGSGKTRTLYALLKALNPKRLNIVTLEDPIEYRIDGLNQVQVNRKMNFADALRSVLRQDPDVILVGEVRDAETAKLCFQAAETGHLVFTTLHANGSLEVIERLSVQAPVSKGFIFSGQPVLSGSLSPVFIGLMAWQI